MTDEPPATLSTVVPVSKQCNRLRRALKYLCSENDNWRDAVGPALTTIDLLEENLEKIRKAILQLDAQGKQS